MARDIGQGDRVEVEYKTSPVTSSEQSGTVGEVTKSGCVVDTDRDLIGSLKIDREAGTVDDFGAEDAVFDLVSIREI